jgi:2-haloacid dehalogenase
MSGDVVCFDMYGTLCDTSSVVDALGETLDAPEGVVAAVDELWRRKQLQYSYQRGQMDAYRPFREVTAEALDYALDYYGFEPSSDDRERVLDSYDHLEPFPDAAETLSVLRDAGYRVAVLSNGNPGMLEALAGNAGFASALDAIVSADEVRTFKPAPAVYENAADRLDADVDACWLVSANAWDVAGASAAGMRTAWVNRAREPFERVGGEPEVTVRGLAGVPAAVTPI